MPKTKATATDVKRGSAAAAHSNAQRKQAGNAHTHGSPSIQFKFNNSLLSGQSGGAAVQGKVNVSSPNDKYEKEADSVADKVMQPFSFQRKCSSCDEAQTKPIAQGITPLVQREAEEDTEETGVQLMEDELQEKRQAHGNAPVQMQEDEEAVQAQGEDDDEGNSPEMMAKLGWAQKGVLINLQDRIRQSRGRGPPMDPRTRMFMESRFGADFRHVSIHTDSQAQEMATALRAHAFATGSDIYFNRGQYRPDTVEGRWLLAHELTHTIQQGAVGPSLKAQRSEDEDAQMQSSWQAYAHAQPKCAACDKEETTQSKCAACEKEEQAQAKCAACGKEEQAQTKCAACESEEKQQAYSIQRSERGPPTLQKNSEDDNVQGGWWDDLCDGISSAFGSLGDWLSDIAETLGNIGESFLRFLENVGDAFLSFLKDVGQALVDFISRLGQAMWNFIKSLGQAMWNFLKGLSTALFKFVVNMGRAFMNFLSNLGAAARQFLTTGDFGAFLQNAGQAFGNLLADVGSAFVTAIMDVGTAVVKFIWDTGSAFFRLVVDAGAAFLSALGTIGLAALRLIVNVGLDFFQLLSDLGIPLGPLTIVKFLLEIANGLLCSEVNFSNGRLTIDIPQIPWPCDAGFGMTHEIELADIDWVIPIPIPIIWPMYPLAFHTIGPGFLRVRLSARALLELGPCCIGTTNIVADVANGFYEACTGISIGARASLFSNVHLGLSHLINMFIMRPGRNQLFLPMVDTELAADGQGFATAGFVAGMYGCLGVSSAGFHGSLAGNVDADMEAAFTASGFGRIAQLGNELCNLKVPLLDAYGFIGMGAGFQMNGLLNMSGFSGSKSSHAYYNDLSMFNSVPDNFRNVTQLDNCPLCDMLYSRGLMPSQLPGGRWTGHPTPAYSQGPLRRIYQVDPNIPSGAKCRGACGPDCDTCTPDPKKVVCTNIPGGKHQFWHYPNYQDCGTHAGCQQHDQCYDWCVSSGNDPQGLGILGPCHRLCDLECACNYPTPQCVGWVGGRPPHTGRMKFSDTPKLMSTCHGECPEGAEPAPAQNEEDEPANPTYRICLDPITIFEEQEVPYDWDYEFPTVELGSTWVTVPYVGPFRISLDLGGSAEANLAATFGPATLTNVCLIADPLNRDYAGTARLELDALLTAALTLELLLEAAIRWLGIAPTFSVDLGAVGYGEAISANQFAMDVEVKCVDGEIKLDSRAAFETCLELMLDLDAFIRVNLLSFRAYEHTWDIFDWSWDECWEVPLWMTEGFVGVGGQGRAVPPGMQLAEPGAELQQIGVHNIVGQLLAFNDAENEANPQDVTCDSGLIPYTNAVWSGTDRGEHLRADPLTKCSHTFGSNPRVRIEDCLSADERRRFWVRAHLLHGRSPRSRRDLHGPGNDKRNLIMTDKSLNGLMYTQVEEDAIDRIHNQNQILTYDVTPRHMGTGPNNRYFADGMTMEVNQIDASGNVIENVYSDTIESSDQRPLPSSCQPKLKVGAPNDKYEQEADAVADKVVQRSAQGNIARKCGKCEGEETAQRRCGPCGLPNELQRKPLASTISPMVQRQQAEEENPLQAKRSRGPPRTGSSFNAQLSASKGGGQPLSAGVQRNMESSFGADFSGVRVHNDSRAASMNNQINAKAFTHGNNIYFNRNAYKPGTSEGNHLLAHELTHTVQQGASPANAQTSKAPDSIQRVSLWDKAGQYWDDPGSALDDASYVAGRAWDDPVGLAGEAVDMGWDTAVDTAEGVLEGAESVINFIAPGLLEFLRSDLVDIIKGKIIGALDLLTGGFLSKISTEGIFDDLGESVGPLIDRLGEVLSGLMQGDCSALMTALSDLMDFASAMAGPAIQSLVEFATDIKDTFSDLWDEFGKPALQAIEQLAGSAWGWVQDKIDWVWDKIEIVKSYAGYVWDWLKEQFDIAWSATGDIRAWLHEKATAAWDLIMDTLAPVITVLKVLVGILVIFSPLGPVLLLWYGVPKLWEAIQWLINNEDVRIWIRDKRDYVQNTIIPAITKGLDAFNGLLKGVVDWFSSITGQIQTAFNNVVTAITETAIFQFLAQGVNLVGSIFNSIFSGIGQLFSAIWTGLGYVFGAIWDFLWPIVRFISGIVFMVTSPFSWPFIIQSLPMYLFWWLIPECIKLEAIDFILELYIYAYQNLPEEGAAGDLLRIVKVGGLTFLYKLKELGPDEIMELLDKFLFMGLHPDFHSGLNLGIITGIVWDGVVGILVMIYDLLVGLPLMLWDMLSFFASMAVDVESLQAIIGRLGGIATEIINFIQQPDAVDELIKLVQKYPEIMMTMIKEGLKQAAEWSTKAAGSIADGLFSWLKNVQPFDLGMNIGRVLGYVLFEILLTVFTASGYAWVKGGGKILQWTMKGMRMLSKGVKAGGKLVSAGLKSLRKIVKAGTTMAKKFSKKLKGYFQKVQGLFDDLIRWFMKAYRKLFGKKKGRGKGRGKLGGYKLQPKSAKDNLKKAHAFVDSYIDKEIGGEREQFHWLPKHYKALFKKGVKAANREAKRKKWKVKARKKKSRSRGWPERITPVFKADWDGSSGGKVKADIKLNPSTSIDADALSYDDFAGSGVKWSKRYYGTHFKDYDKHLESIGYTRTENTRKNHLRIKGRGVKASWDAGGGGKSNHFLHFDGTGSAQVIKQGVNNDDFKDFLGKVITDSDEMPEGYYLGRDGRSGPRIVKKKKGCDSMETLSLDEEKRLQVGTADNSGIEDSIIDNSTTSQYGKEMVARRLTRVGVAGQPAGRASYKADWDDHLVKREHNNRSMYIRGHMLNENTHGLANWDNLVPFTQEANKYHLVQVETEMKYEVAAGKYVFYRVWVSGGKINKQTKLDGIIKDAKAKEAAATKASDKAKFKKIWECATREKDIPDQVNFTCYSFDRDPAGAKPYPYLGETTAKIKSVSASNAKWKSGKKVATGNFKTYHDHTNSYDSVSQYKFTN